LPEQDVGHEQGEVGKGEPLARPPTGKPHVGESVLRLEKAGIIRGYALKLDPAALGYPVCAYVRVRPAPG